MSKMQISEKVFSEKKCIFCGKAKCRKLSESDKIFVTVFFFSNKKKVYKGVFLCFHILI